MKLPTKKSSPAAVPRILKAFWPRKHWKHVELMDCNGRPKTVFYSEIAPGCRPNGKPKNLYKDQLKYTLKRCNIKLGEF